MAGVFRQSAWYALYINCHIRWRVVVLGILLRELRKLMGLLYLPTFLLPGLYDDSDVDFLNIAMKTLFITSVKNQYHSIQGWKPNFEPLDFKDIYLFDTQITECF